ncbi:MAG TPA: hypothetical protein VFY04_07060 [Solirubrobacterales bacterium]|nr:hypothetical protein [Solirubrobacterales bacterium]
MRVPAPLIALLLCLALGACGSEGGESAPEQAAEVLSPRSAPFERYSGKGPGELALARFGAEAGEEDRLAAQAQVAAYLRALAERRFEAACGYLGQSPRAQIAEVIRKSKRTPRPSCGEVLVALVAAAKARRPSPVAGRPIASLRVKEGGAAGEGAGFALFHGADGKDYWLAVKREGGGWRVLSSAPQEFE